MDAPAPAAPVPALPVSGPRGRIFRPRRAAARLAALLALALLPASTAPLRAAETGGSGGLRGLIRAGEKAPPFTLRDTEGTPVAFRPGEGPPTLLVFFSAFCPLCRELTPAFNAMQDRKEPPVRVLGVNLDGKRFAPAVQTFLKEAGVAFPVVLDEIREDLFVATDPYGVDKTPTAVLVDGTGTVRGRWPGEEARGFIRDAGALLPGLLDQGQAVPK